MPTQTLGEIREFLLKSHHVACGEALTLGNVVNTIFRANDEWRNLVVKIGLTDRAITEIEMNKEGYKNMLAIGAGRLLPDPLIYLQFQEVPIIVMEDCGPDFWHAVNAEANPQSLYHKLTTDMESVYAATRHTGDGWSRLDSLRQRLVRQYRQHLMGLVETDLVDKLQKLSLANLVAKTLCFASFDFTPEDVFVTSRGVRYVDPLPEVTGVPIIDMACFGGVARDGFNLPWSAEGYEYLRLFAVQVIAELLNLSKEQAERIFAMGRALQLALSARFRLVSEPERAQKLAVNSEKSLREFLA